MVVMPRRKGFLGKQTKGLHCCRSNYRRLPFIIRRSAASANEGSGMAALTGIVRTGDGPADGAYVQIRNLEGDFQGEVRTNAEGKFALHPVPGRWRLVSWLPGQGQTEKDVEVGDADVQVELTLS